MRSPQCNFHWVDPELKDRTERYAEANGMSVAGFIRYALSQAMKQDMEIIDRMDPRDILAHLARKTGVEL